MHLAAWRSLTAGAALAAAAQFCVPDLLLASDDMPSFEQKTVTLIIGYAAGGGVDASGRLIAQYLSKHLPGNPAVVVRNMPGADGMIALNFLVRQVKPDGMTLTVGSSTQLDPTHYRAANSQYDPTTFQFIGGISRGGTFLIASKNGEQRLADKSGDPAPMGAVDGTRSGEQMVSWGMEFLGWNARWVTGYRGANDTTVALERGEVDLATTANAFLIKRLLDTGKFKLLAQSGIVVNGQLQRRSDFADVPVFSELLAGRIQDAAARDAFDYWEAMCVMDPWAALPPDTPAPIVAAYRKAFGAMMHDAEFLERGKKISEDIGGLTHADMESMVKTAAAKLTPSAETFLRGMQAKQGLRPKQ